MDRVKVLFDTDIGSDIDDALALAYLLSQERCELLGITTGTGEPEKRSEMASAVCRNMGRGDIPIHSGCPEAILVRMRQTEAPQARALGNWDRQKQFVPGTAVEFLRRTILDNPGEITLLAVGPMTNLGVLFALDPHIAGMLKQVVLMCGMFSRGLQGEWNAVGDPHATAITYGNGCQSRPPRHVSYGLDVTLRCTMPADDCRKRFTAKSLAPVRDFAEVWFQRASGVCFHDPLAAACVFEPEICTYKQGKVNVSLHEPTFGWTVLDQNADPKPHTVAHEVNSQAFFDHYFGTLR